jgi:hypothetical protein
MSYVVTGVRNMYVYFLWYKAFMHFIDVIRRVHAKFPEFRMHRGGDMNLSLFLFSEFCVLKE